MPDIADEPPWRQPGYVFTRAGDGCWGCRFQKLGGWETFLGFCGWFPEHGQPKKPIPNTVVAVGCKWWENKRG